jgi:hypothetical protein
MRNRIEIIADSYIMKACMESIGVHSNKRMVKLYDVADGSRLKFPSTEVDNGGFGLASAKARLLGQLKSISKQKKNCISLTN